jgi:DNA polymerase III delta prime subunit
MFTRATKTQAKLRLTFDGPAGSGKTYSALVLARALGGKAALIDTEHGSASKYASLFEFDTVSLSEFSLDTYLRTIAAAKAAGYEVLIIDSLSHAWTGKGGALEEVDRRGGNNKFTNGWREVTPKQNQLVDAILAFPGHVIATLRTKTDYVIEEVNGKKVPRKVGMAPVQRDGVEYEFDVVADLDVAGNLSITKTRCPELSGALLKHADVASMGEKLRAWLSDGAPAPAPAPEAPKGGADEWATDGAPASPRARVEVALGGARSKEDLDKVVADIKRLPKSEQDALRPLFTQKLAEVRNGAAKR